MSVLQFFNSYFLRMVGTLEYTLLNDNIGNVNEKTAVCQIWRREEEKKIVKNRKPIED